MDGVLWLKLFFRIFISFLLFSMLGSSQTILDVDELSVQYGIEITNKPVMLNSQPVDDNVLQLSSKHGQLYSCFLPQLPTVDDQEPSKGSTVEDVVDILDKSLNGTCMSYKKGWWTYKLCHKESITQYHVAEIGDVVGPTTTLGLFSSEDDWSKEEVLQRKPSEIFHSHQYVNGSMCDVTQKRRSSTVQYFCATKPTDDIIRIEEPATCEYIITVHSNKLCTHSLFSKKEKKKQINLICSPALLEHEYNKYMEKLSRKKAAEEVKKLEVLKKKMALDKAEKAKAKVSGSNDKVLHQDDSSVKGEQLQLNDKKDGKLKNAVNDISSFMKGFLKVLNIKSEDVKLTTKVIKDGQEIKYTKGVNIDDLESELKQVGIKEVEDNAKDVDPGVKGGKDDTSIKGLEVEMNEDKDTEKSTKIIKDSVSDYFDMNVDLEGDDDMTKDIEKDVDPGNEIALPDNENEKPGTLKTLNDITESMIKQLERDSKKMHRKAVKEREVMHREFDRVRKNALHELGKSQNMLDILESLKKGKRSESSRKDIDEKIRTVRTLVKNLQEQIRTIDEKRKTVDELEKDTNKRLHDINNKILNTRTAHKFAKSLESFATENNAEDDFNKIITSVFNKNKEKLGIKAGKEVNPEKADDVNDDDDDDNEDEEDETKLQEKGDYNTLLKDLEVPPPGDSKATASASKNRHSKLMKKMINSLKDHVLKHSHDVNKIKLGKGDTATEYDKTATDTPDGDLDPSINDLIQHDISSKTGLNTLVEMLKKEMGKINEKIKKEKENVSPDARSKDKNEKESIEETEKDAKDKMEVRIRTIDEKSFDKEFDKEIDDNVRDEVKEATKKMEDTVRKQLKDAGLDFSDNIKIKIITTKDKFDQFSSGKDVKLLSENDAADFKDLLLGFLGGGKEKVSEEQRQKTLEDNYNFVLNEDEE